MAVFILIVTIGGQTVSRDCDEALCFTEKSKCEYMAQRLNYRSDAPKVFAWCEAAK